MTEGFLSNSLLPSQNFKGIHNFSLGDGKSDSFFFFSDDQIFMMKTMKKSEMDIMFEDGFLVDYF